MATRIWHRNGVHHAVCRSCNAIAIDLQGRCSDGHHQANDGLHHIEWWLCFGADNPNVQDGGHRWVYSCLVCRMRQCRGDTLHHAQAAGASESDLAARILDATVGPTHP